MSETPDTQFRAQLPSVVIRKCLRLFAVLLIVAPCVGACRMPVPPNALRPDPLLTPGEVTNSLARAERGDGDAAWALAVHYGVDNRDDKAFLYWQHKAVQFGCAFAQYSLASDIESRRVRDYTEFGPTLQEAVRSLLERAATTNPTASGHLASLCASGYFGTADVITAICYYRKAAELGSSHSAGRLAQLLPLTDAANRMEEAYYWCALSTMYAHPGSVGGKEKWTLRLKLSSQLDLGTLERVWTKIDKDIAGVRSGRRKLDPPLFNFGSSDEDAERVYREGVQAVDEKEKEYRSSRRGRKALSSE